MCCENPPIQTAHGIVNVRDYLLCTYLGEVSNVIFMVLTFNFVAYLMERINFSSCIATRMLFRIQFSAERHENTQTKDQYSFCLSGRIILECCLSRVVLWSSYIEGYFIDTLMVWDIFCLLYLFQLFRKFHCSWEFVSMGGRMKFDCIDAICTKNYFPVLQIEDNPIKILNIKKKLNK